MSSNIVIDIQSDGSDLPSEEIVAQRIQEVEDIRSPKKYGPDADLWEQFFYDKKDYLSGKSNSLTFAGDYDYDDLHYEVNFNSVPPVNEWTYVEHRLLSLAMVPILWQEEEDIDDEGFQKSNGKAKELFRWINNQLPKESQKTDTFGFVATILQEKYRISIEEVIRLGTDMCGYNVSNKKGTSSYGRWILALDAQHIPYLWKCAKRKGSFTDLLDLFLEHKPTAIEEYIPDMVLPSYAKVTEYPPIATLKVLCKYFPQNYKEVVYTLFDTAYKNQAWVMSYALELLWDNYPEEIPNTYDYTLQTLEQYRIEFNAGRANKIGFTGNDIAFMEAIYTHFGDTIYPAVEKYFIGSEKFNGNVFRIIFKCFGQKALPITEQLIDVTISEKFEYAFFTWLFAVYHEFNIDLNPMVPEMKKRFNGDRAIAQIFASQLVKLCDKEKLRTMAEGTKQGDLLVALL